MKFTILMGLLFSVISFADEPPAPVDNTACAADVKLLCPASKNKSDTKNCLTNHQDKLSPACAKAFQESSDTSKKMHRVCAEPIEKYCAGKSITKCLRRHYTELTQECRDAVEEKRASRKSSYQ